MGERKLLTFRTLHFLYFVLLVAVGVYSGRALLTSYGELKAANRLAANAGVAYRAPDKPPPESMLQHYRAIWERSLFSVPGEENRGAGTEGLLAQIDNLPTTSLNYTLVGTIFNINGPSWAFIEDARSKRQDRYTVGSTLGGAKVVAILRRKVVLNVEGKDQVLVMGTVRAEAAQPDTVTPRKEDQEEDRTGHQVSREVLRESRSSLARTMSKLRIRPHLEDGVPAGFQVTRVADDSEFKAMGLESGDIIQGINDQDIVSGQDIKEFYNALSEGGDFTITVVRGDEVKSLSYEAR